MSAELLGLAERVEGLTAGDRAVADEILLACGWIAGSNDEGEIAQWIDPSGASWSSFDLPDPTSSLDAAVSLIVERSLWSVCDMEDGPYAQVIRPMPGGGYVNGLTTAKAATPALALTAAALRAIASISEVTNA